MGFSLGGLWDDAKGAGKTALGWGSGYSELKAMGLMPETGQPGVTGPEQQLLDRNNALATREQAGYDQQQQLAKMLMGASLGQGPSLAGLQLNQGLEQINRGSMNQAAGAGGNNGVLARYAAMGSAAQAGAQTNQQAALARADEINQARALLGQNLGNMGQQTGNLYGANLTGYGNQRGIDVKQQENANALRTKLLGSALGAVSGGGAQGAVSG